MVDNPASPCLCEDALKQTTVERGREMAASVQSATVRDAPAAGSVRAEARKYFRKRAFDFWLEFRAMLRAVN